MLENSLTWVHNHTQARICAVHTCFLECTHPDIHAHTSRSMTLSDQLCIINDCSTQKTQQADSGAQQSDMTHSCISSSKNYLFYITKITSPQQYPLCHMSSSCQCDVRSILSFWKISVRCLLESIRGWMWQHCQQHSCVDAYAIWWGFFCCFFNAALCHVQ